jgi:hypothetical protein
MSKEQLVTAVNSSDLGMEADVVHDVDRLAAMATGNTLGGLLFRFAASAQPQWGKRIVLILAMRVMRGFRLSRSIAEKVATCALMEFYKPNCVTCNGAREVMTIEKLKIVCETCGGSGRHRWSNNARRDFIGAYGKRIDDAMAKCHNDLWNSFDAYIGHAHGRLA